MHFGLVLKCLSFNAQNYSRMTSTLTNTTPDIWPGRLVFFGNLGQLCTCKTSSWSRRMSISNGSSWGQLRRQGITDLQRPIATPLTPRRALLKLWQSGQPKVQGSLDRMKHTYKHQKVPIHHKFIQSSYQHSNTKVHFKTLDHPPVADFPSNL